MSANSCTCGLLSATAVQTERGEVPNPPDSAFLFFFAFRWPGPVGFHCYTALDRRTHQPRELYSPHARTGFCPSPPQAICDSIGPESQDVTPSLFARFVKLPATGDVLAVRFPGEKERVR